MPCKISVIIPFRERPGDPGSVQRLDAAIACFAGMPCIDVVVFDTGRRSAQEKLANHQLANLRYFHQFQPGVFAPGRVRNNAVLRATGRYIFLFDADLLVSRDLVSQLSGFVQALESEGPQAFLMFPCLYLSQSYSPQFAAGFVQPVLQSVLYREVFQSYLQGDVCRVDGIALASSCLVINREWFLAIGGFREEFAGHGYEDFDLIHRLAGFYPIGKRPADYPEDIKSQFPGDYRGLRRYFSYYAVPHLFSGAFLLHQWHARPLSRKYHRKRKDNEARFAGILREPVLTLAKPLEGCQATGQIQQLLSTGWVTPDTGLADFGQWLQEQQAQAGYPLSQYPGLFCYRAGVKKTGGSPWRKLRKLILKPGAFFRDAFGRNKRQ